MGAKLFGLKQKVVGFIGSIVSLVVIISICQGGHFFYKSKVNLDSQMEVVMTDRLKKLNDESISNVLQAQASFRELVVGSISNLAGSYVQDPKAVNYQFVSLGQARDIDEAMVERFRLSYAYPASFKLLWALPISLNFKGETEILVKPNGGLSAYVKK